MQVTGIERGIGMKGYRWILWVSLILGSISGIYACTQQLANRASPNVTWIIVNLLGETVGGIAGWCLVLLLFASPFMIRDAIKRKKGIKKDAGMPES